MELFDPVEAGREPVGEGTGTTRTGSAASPSTGAIADLVVSHLDSFPRARSMVELGVLRGHLDAYEAGVLASAIDDGATDRDIDGLSRRGGGSKRTVRKKTKRAKAVRKNPKLGDKLRDGSLNDEKVDAIADASDKSDGAAAEDEQLIADIEDAPVDQAGDIVRTWLNNHEDPDKTETRYQKQRRTRGARQFETKHGNAAIMVEGDDSTIDAIWNQMVKDAQAAYQAAGGRDLPGAKHATTHLQRLFDAFVSRITRTTENNDDETGAAKKLAARADTGRPTVFASLSLDPDTGDISRAELAGGGPLPQSVLERFMCNADVIAAAFDQTGEVLWQGRKLRTTTAAQFKALIARDGGCVLCRAHYLLCEAHHLLPWNAPDKGKTDVDEMALLCQSCHHHVHDNNLTLERAGPAPPGERKPGHNRAASTDPSRSKTKAAPPGTERAAPSGPANPAGRPRTTWTTRPATPNETPPPRPRGS